MSDNPSGWQQRIRELPVYWTNDTGLVPIPEHVRERLPDFGWLSWKKVRAILDEAEFEGQNAKDAIPQAQDRDGVCQICGDRLPHPIEACGERLSLKDALPPAPEGSPAKECSHCGDGGVIETKDGPFCAICYHPLEADASPKERE